MPQGTILHVATHAEEAFEVLNDLTISPDYIFLDINLPVLTGKEILKQLKETTHLKDIPVIMCSTSNRKEEMELCKKMGAIDFIVKPSEFQTFCQVLKKFL